MDSDESLYAQLRAGDIAAFDALYGRYDRRLLGFAIAQLGDVHEAEDVSHEAFLAVLQSPSPQLRCFKAWLFQVTRNLCLNRMRSRVRGRDAIAALEPEPEPEPEPDLRAAIARLPSPLAELYHLRASGLSYDEVAATLQLPLGTVKSRIHEMVKRLREDVSKETP